LYVRTDGLMIEEPVLSKTLPLPHLLRNAAWPLPRNRSTPDRDARRPLPWSDAARLMLVFSVAGWAGLILLWNLVF
jgi:hypothetical protein